MTLLPQLLHPVPQFLRCDGILCVLCDHLTQSCKIVVSDRCKNLLTE